MKTEKERSFRQPNTESPTISHSLSEAMETSLCTFSPTKPHPPKTLTLKPERTLFSIPTSPSFLRPKPSSLAIRAAISRTKKEETVETLKKQLENCHLIAGISYKGLTVKQFQDLRKSLPDSVKLIVAKNTLINRAIDGTPWEALRPCLSGMNAWLFVHTEEIPTAIKPYRDFQKEMKLAENDFTGAVFEGKFYAPSDFKALETMPTRAEIYAKLLGAMQSPALSLVSTLQAPARDLVLVLSAYVKKLEEEGGGN